MTTPEGFVARYLARRGKLSAPGSADLAAIKGYLYAPKCSCGHPRRHEVWNEKARRHFMRCAKCGRIWPRRLALVPRAAIQGGRRADPDAALADLATLRLVLDSLSEFERRVFLLYVTWRGPGRADSGIAELGRRRWPEAPFPWTQHQVRKLVRAAQAQVEREAARRGLD